MDNYQEQALLELINSQYLFPITNTAVSSKRLIHLLDSKNLEVT